MSEDLFSDLASATQAAEDYNRAVAEAYYRAHPGFFQRYIGQPAERIFPTDESMIAVVVIATGAALLGAAFGAMCRGRREAKRPQV